MKRRVNVALLAAALAALTCAAVAWAEAWPVKYNAADQAAARAAVLKKSDLGTATGWKGGATKPDFSPSTCTLQRPKVSDLLVTGAAAAEWTYAEALTFHSETWVLKTAAMVKLDWQRTVAHPSLVPCFRQEFGTQFGTQPGMKLVSIQRISLPKLAPLARRYRVLIDLTQEGETVRLLSDLILIGKGRMEISLLTIAPYADRQDVQAAEVRLARALVARAKA
jgi:hypothetical protein